MEQECRNEGFRTSYGANAPREPTFSNKVTNGLPVDANGNPAVPAYDVRLRNLIRDMTRFGPNQRLTVRQALARIRPLNPDPFNGMQGLVPTGPIPHQTFPDCLRQMDWRDRYKMGWARDGLPARTLPR